MTEALQERWVTVTTSGDGLGGKEQCARHESQLPPTKSHLPFLAPPPFGDITVHEGTSTY